MKPGSYHIGTSGWSYAHWAKGVFYPRGMKAGEWLPFLAGFFNTVEVNSSFYRLPRPEIVARWQNITPARFRFAMKMWRRITHEKRLRDCDSEVRAFLQTIGELSSKRGPILVQLPPSMRRDDDLLDQFLTSLRREAGRWRLKVAVELRHTTWLCADVCELLDRHNAALCLADLPQYPVTEPNNAKFVYIRRHGPTGAYRGLYTPEHIKADAQSIQTWLREGRDVWVYYNNDIEGYAVVNAAQLMEALEQA
jgi:uncharacterized protein YecE (DUF72 family)